MSTESSGRMWLDERSRTSRVDLAYRKILGLITEGALAEGARLPSETEMAKAFGVSRPVVRQALTRLQEAGVVDVRWGAGSYVRDISGGGQGEPRFGPIQGLDEVRFTYELRIAIESEAAGLAAQRQGPLDAAKEALAALQQAMIERTLGQEEDLAFHMAIAAASLNPYFERVLRSIRRPLEFSINLTRTLSLTHSEAQLRVVQAEHVAVVEAIGAGDPQAARDAMRVHLQNACQRIYQGPGNA